MKKLKALILLAIGLALALLVVQNTASTQARFLWLTAEVPVMLLLFMAAAGGFFIGLFVGFFVTGGTRSDGSKQREELVHKR